MPTEVIGADNKDFNLPDFHPRYQDVRVSRQWILYDYSQKRLQQYNTTSGHPAFLF